MIGLATTTFAQYKTAERNDTVYLLPKTPFDAAATKRALEKGTCTIKGVAFARPIVNGIRMGKKILANKITVYLFPLTPYFEEHLAQKKQQNPRKLKFAFVSPECVQLKLTSITNSSGEFIFPDMKPGRYYIEGLLPWSETGVTSEKTGYIDDPYGGADVYTKRQYRNDYEDYIHAIVEIKKEGETVNIKLRDNSVKW
ncbi:hypothetical protein A8C56_14680 [Niabella ginsenosidivorans]|uniref:Carboxypeptidase regulatory-like domain-containing protein n=2 Tax=Niabella ginsenosidivorans TaxID=1176587 RepID=A0A1A9I4S4_9BACT|nr:hypothetical protein A8C56_14680 [Niabella ginsenosidivorans]